MNRNMGCSTRPLPDRPIISTPSDFPCSLIIVSGVLAIDVHVDIPGFNIYLECREIFRYCPTQIRFKPFGCHAKLIAWPNPERKSITIILTRYNSLLDNEDAQWSLLN